MIKTAFILSMIICNACYGQLVVSAYDSVRYDRIEINSKSYPMQINYRKGAIMDSMIWTGGEERKRDTVEVILLVTSDTGPIAFRMEGYSVREIHNEAEGTIDWGMDHNRPPEDYGVHLYYLDKYKKELPKNIIVWQSKELQ